MWLWDDLCIWTSLKLSRKKLTTTLKTEHFSLHNTIFCVARVFSLVKCITKSCWKIFLRANEFCMVESKAEYCIVIYIHAVVPWLEYSLAGNIGTSLRWTHYFMIRFSRRPSSLPCNLSFELLLYRPHGHNVSLGRINRIKSSTTGTS